MAVRFSAETDGYKAITGLPAGATPWTIACWVYVSVDRNTVSGPWAVANTTTENAATASSVLATDATGTDVLTYRDFNVGITGSAPNLPVGAWYKTAVTKNGSAVTYYWGTDSGSLTATPTASAAAITPAALYIGRSVWSGEWWNGRVAAFKMWDAELPAGQVAVELAQYAPARTANLLRYHPFHAAETPDYSGNGNNLTAGGTTPTTEAGPPIPVVVSSPRPQPLTARRRSTNW